MTVVLVHGAPLALLVSLVVWTCLDFMSRASSLGLIAGVALSAMSPFVAIYGSLVLQPSLHRASRAMVGTAFIGERLFLLGIDPLPMIGFIVLLMLLGSLQSIERIFVPVYLAAGVPALKTKVDSALMVAYTRTLGLLGFVFLGSTLLALLVPMIGFQSRNLLAAFGLALALIFIIAWLAIMPTLPSRLRAWANRRL